VIGTERTESFLDALLHPDKVPPEALAGSMTAEKAWASWAAGESPRSSAESWWHHHFEQGHKQEPGTELGRTKSRAAVQELEREAG
jgi:hypothetical protein